MSDQMFEGRVIAIGTGGTESEALRELRASLDKALDIENPIAKEPNSCGRYACHACGSTVSEPTGGCVNSKCWVETAEMLQRHLQASDT